MYSMQSTHEWHRERKGKVTASVAGTIIGVNKYQKATELWKEMTGQKKPFTGNYFTQYGTRNEPNALNAYVHQTLNNVESVGFVQHKCHDWMGGSPDGLVDQDGLVEFKCPNPRSKSMYTDDTIPLHYFVQCQLLMEVTDRQWCDLFVWTLEENRVWRFKRDVDFFDYICPMLAHFHGNVANGTTPPAPSPNIVTNTEAAMRASMVPTPVYGPSPFSKRLKTSHGDGDDAQVGCV
jgi:putative phage-type endonuclease